MRTRSRPGLFLVLASFLIFAGGLSPVFSADTASRDVSAFPPTQSSEGDTEGVGGFTDPFATGTKTQDQNKIKLSDPLEPWNRFMMDINRTGYDYLGEPVARFYRDYTPQLMRHSVHRFFNNLYEPTYALNGLLQGRWHDAGVSTRRFIINTTFGGLGFFDPAGEHLKRVERDFDQTLSKWGVAPGFYLVWPIIGPSSPRGTVGYLVDESMDPLNYIGEFEEASAASTYRLIDEASFQIGQFEAMDKFTVDEYAAIKDYYENQLYKEKHN